MAEMSPHIKFFDPAKIDGINPETKRLWRRYEADMKIRGLSDGTVAGYKNDMEQFFIWIYDNLSNIPITDIGEEDITEFILYCQDGGNNSRRIKRRLSSISAFYKFLRKKRIITENPMEFIDRPKKDVDVLKKIFLTEEQVADIRAMLIKNCEEAKTVFQKHAAISDRLYVLFSLSTMARVAAISSIRWDMVDLEARTVSDVLEKEGKIVTLYFSKEVRDVMKELIDYRAENEIDDGGWVFVARDLDGYHRAGKSTLTQWCKAIGRDAGIPEIHPHTWRKTGSNLLKAKGMPLEDIASLLHHESSDTTQKFYIKKDNSQAAAKKDLFEV